MRSGHFWSSAWTANCSVVVVRFSVLGRKIKKTEAPEKPFSSAQLPLVLLRLLPENIQPPTHFLQRARRFPPTDRKTLINIHDMMRHKRRNAHTHTHTHTPLDTCTQNCFGGTNSRKLEDSFRHRRETGWPTSYNQQLQEVVTFNPYSWNDS